MAEPDNECANRLKTVPVTVLFADIVDSIDLYARLGNEAAKQLIDGLFNDLSHLVADHRGTVVKSIGDELMCSFHLPLFAINAARDTQRLTEVLNGPCSASAAIPPAMSWCRMNPPSSPAITPRLNFAAACLC